MAASGELKPAPPIQHVGFHAFDHAELPSLLNWEGTALSAEAPLQLRHISEHLEELGCRTVAIERHYVDRDYMEEHATFYSKSLCSYENYCARAHFFRGERQDIESNLTALVTEAHVGGAEQYRQKCRAFSKEQYLGFMVVKPLPGCPVGKTVLMPGEPPAASQLYFECLRLYRVHLAGTVLEVRGLAFQQQDVGVSACATTAIWSAFQKVHDFEEVAAASPAQITMLAARYTLPFGRAMPSEGLSIDQMCLAVQALGASPQLLRARDHDTARGYLYSINVSGMSCILIMRRCGSEDECHAVSVVGIKCNKNHTAETPGTGADDRASDLDALYIHDDRLGPYITAKLEIGHHDRLVLQLQVKDATHGMVDLPGEKWNLEHILLPMHAKVRLSFGELWDITISSLVPWAHGIRTAVLKHPKHPRPDIEFRVSVLQAQAYIEGLLLAAHPPNKNLVYEIGKTVAFSRYVGIVRLSSPFMGSIDVVVDTTSTLNNPIFLLVLPLDGKAVCWEMARALAIRQKCAPPPTVSV